MSKHKDSKLFNKKSVLSTATGRERSGRCGQSGKVENANRFLSAHYMPLDDLASFVDQELGTIGLTGGSAEPSGRICTAGPFRRPQGTFGVGMRNPPPLLFGLPYGLTRQEARLIVLAGPDVIRNLRDGRSNILHKIIFVHILSLFHRCFHKYMNIPYDYEYVHPLSGMNEGRT